MEDRKRWDRRAYAPLYGLLVLLELSFRTLLLGLGGYNDVA